ncbi:Wzz/FepE/Etk N-terminal domain-containing protein [Actinomycetospora lemnae]|uniref:Wzz/FepE/Etk N-terminal domain-containing protein n=1 Tax=Actinomycetospora lemnae TaxID=3019891 RepID=A0ABT5SVF4_9PSEU|nr:Wzz/FepE/Etk N-terminal domain-containing protein [Actinomycetospora sp. DW7H6]MDD7966806.1 Wzz/FepE/Etk N-terminal domain-containing protein [Actinomycetospora sp. DW7H6]
MPDNGPSRVAPPTADGTGRRSPRHGATDSPTQQLGPIDGTARAPGFLAERYIPDSTDRRFKPVTVSDVARRWRTVLACALVALLAGTAYLVLAGPGYTSRASLLLASTNPSESSGQETRADLETESRVVVSEPILAAAGRGVGADFRELADSVEATPITNTRILQLTVRGPTPEEAMLRTEAILNIYRSERVKAQQTEIDQYREYVAQELARNQQARDNARVNAGTQSTLDAQRSQLLTDLSIVEGAARSRTGGVSVIDPPQAPSSFSFYLLAAIQSMLAAGIGGVIGVAIIVARLSTSMFVETERQLSSVVGLPVLARVDRSELTKKCEDQGEEPSNVLDSKGLDAVRRALTLARSRTHVLCSVGETNVNRLAALNVALGTAARGRSVVLFTTMNFPEADEMLNAENAPAAGLAGLSRGWTSVREIALPPERTSVANLWFVPRNPDDDNVALLAVPEIQQAFLECSRWWGVCYIACVAEDLPLLGDAAKAVVLLVDLGSTDEAALRETVRGHHAAGHELVGFVVAEG